MDKYESYTKEDLIHELERLKKNGISDDDESAYANRMLTNMIVLRKTLSDVLTLLLSSPGNEVIDQALLIILKFFDVDRVYIGIFDETSATVDFTHEVTYGGIISMREDLLRELSEKEIPWWVGKIRAGEDIIILDVSKMPVAAAAEQQLLHLQDVKSLLVLPVVREGKVNGFIGLDSVRKRRAWSAMDVENLRMLADIVSIAIERELAQNLIERSARLALQSEAKFQIIFEKLPWGVELYDEFGNLLDLNNADLEIFGTTRETAVGVNAFTNPNIPKWVNDKLRNGEDVTFTLDYNFKKVSETGYYATNIKQKTKHLQVKGVSLKDQQDTIFGYLYIVFDDTENYIKTEQTQYNLAKLKVAVDTGDSIIWEYDVETDKINADFGLNENLDENPELSLIGKSEMTCLSDFISSLYPDDAAKVYDQKLKRLLNGDIDNYTAVYRRYLGGKLFWFNSNVRSYKFNEDGTPSKVICYSSNITKQQESENELIRVKEADKLKSAFLANMSHEIRTPLNAIVGFSDIVAETNDEVERQTYLDIIHKNNELLLHLIDDILDFSKIESGTLDYHIVKTDIKAICGEVFLSDSLKMKPEVKLVFDKNLPSIQLKTDEKRIIQVLNNFVNNAIKFTNNGHITISYQHREEYLYVSVQDTGIGIAEENRVRIFERFIKINDFKQGTGLGLTISKTIIESLGGTIGVDSVVGKGSTFWFTLPLECENVELSQESGDWMDRSTETEVTENPKSILIAEDVPENFILLQALLGQRYKIHHAWNGQEAVDIYKKTQPDLILMDIKMPIMDGFEATSIIRELSATIPIIALTAFAYESEKQKAMEHKFSGYIVKPIDINKLRELVGSLFSACS